MPLKHKGSLSVLTRLFGSAVMSLNAIFCVQSLASSALHLKDSLSCSLWDKRYYKQHCRSCRNCCTLPFIAPGMCPSSIAPGFTMTKCLLSRDYLAAPVLLAPHQTPDCFTAKTFYTKIVQSVLWPTQKSEDS